MYYTDVKTKLEDLKRQQEEPEVPGTTATATTDTASGRPTCTQQ